MKIKDIIDRLRKGVKAGMAAVKESNSLTDTRVVYLIEKFKSSGKREMMLEGERYYQVDNDIRDRKITKKVNGHNVEESWRANNKLAHAKYKSQVDEKIAYLLSKPVAYKTSEDAGSSYADKIKDILDMRRQTKESGGCRYMLMQKGT